MPKRKPQKRDRLEPLSMRGLSIEKALKGAMEVKPPEDKPSSARTRKGKKKRSVREKK